MAENEQEETPKKPAKIKLGQTNGNGLPQPKLPSEGIQEAATVGKPGDDTTRIDLGGESGTSEGLKPAKASLQPKEDTTRIDLPSVPKPVAKPPGKSQTARLDLSAAKPPKPAAAAEEDTSRINLKAASAKKPDTARIDLSQTFAATQPVDAPSASDTQPVSPVVSSPSADTAKIDLGTATPPAIQDTEPLPPPSEAPTRGIQQLTEEEREEILKQSTIRSELDAAAEEAAGSDFSPTTSGIPAEDQVDSEREEILKQSTMRVELDGIQPEADAPSAAQNKTMRVELDQEVVQAKSQTARIDLPEDAAESASARISIKEDDASADVFKRHAAAAAAASIAATAAAPKKSETARTDVETPPPAPAPAPEAEAGKSKTARIEMPAEAVNAPAGRPKTIKIKRADAAPPMRATAAPKAGVKRSGRKSAAATDDSELGALYSILAIASVIVIGVLLYVLAAQTVAPTLPFMGKIG